MSIFTHISVFISIILGLAVVHLLAGISLILDTRRAAKVYWVHLLWTFNMLFLVVLVWLSSFVLSPLEQFGALHFLNLLCYSVVSYLMSGLLFPVQGDEIINFREHFTANRKRLYVLGLVFVIVDATDGVLEHFKADIDWDIGQFATLSVWFILFLVGLRLQHSRFDVILSLAFLIGLIGWFISLIDTGVLAW